jgi:hypothetical protein
MKMASSCRVGERKQADVSAAWSRLTSNGEPAITHSLFSDQDVALSTSSKSVDHDLITEDIELLLFFSLNVLGTGQTDPIENNDFRRESSSR